MRGCIDFREPLRTGWRRHVDFSLRIEKLEPSGEAHQAVFNSKIRNPKSKICTLSSGNHWNQKNFGIIGNERMLEIGSGDILLIYTDNGIGERIL